MGAIPPEGFYIIIRAILVGLWIAGIGSFAQASADDANVISDFAKLEDTWAVEISPDGNTLAVGCTHKSMRSVCIFPLAGDIESGVYPGTDDVRLVDFYWASNDHLIIITDGTSVEVLTSGVENIRFNRAISYNARKGKSALLLKDYMNFSNTTSMPALLPEKPDKVIMSLLQGTVGRNGVRGARRSVVMPCITRSMLI